MKKVMIISLVFLIGGCANTKELSAPCTYDHRAGCGELIYKPMSA